MDEDEQELLSQALARCADGDTTTARALLSLVLARDPAHAFANHQMGLLAFGRGDLPAAEQFIRKAALSDPGEPEFHNNLGVVRKALGDLAGAREAFEAAISLNVVFAQAQNNLGTVLEATGEDWEAIQCYRRALAIDSGYIDACENLNMACVKSAPPWHFPMMADAERNEAYDAALRRAAPGRRVLDIGTGSGLLAMMAARAGAVVVDTCETVGPIARAAAGIVAVNGFADRIQVHAKHSEQLRIGTDMAARADLLVTETFASGVLSEAVLPTLEHARRALLTPDAVVIPSHAAARGYLVAGADLEGQLYAPRATGFDLSGFEVFAPNKAGLHLDRLPHEALSEDFEIFHFDLTRSSFPPERAVLAVTATRTGRCVGVAQWLWLRMDAETVYENRPRWSAGANGWMHVFYRFDQPLDVAPGDVIHLLASHSRTAMTVTLAKP